MNPSARPVAKLHGRSFPQHVAALVTFSVLSVGFLVLSFFSVEMLSAVPIRWLVAGFLLLSSGLSAAWELRLLFLMRRGRTDPP
jgi:hypothetical protein